MSRILFAAKTGSVFLSATLIFSATAYAEPPKVIKTGNQVQINRENQTVAPAQLLPFVQKFKTMQDTFQFLATAFPSHFEKWSQWAAQEGIAKTLTSDFRAEGQKLYFKNLPTPFQFSNDGKTVTYKGIGVAFSATQSPQDNFKKAEKAWGGFQELKNKKVSRGRLLLFAPTEAYASDPFDNMLNGTAISAIGNIVGWTGIAIGSTAAVMTGTAVSAAGLSYALFTFAKEIYFLTDRKAGMMSDAELRCTNWGPDIQGSKTSGVGSGVFRDSVKAGTITENEAEQARQALVEICKKPEAVAAFNESLFHLKQKILKGEAKFFEKQAAAKTPLGNPMGDPTPTSK